MKRTARCAQLVLSACLLLPLVPASGLEIGSSLEVSNMNFLSGRTPSDTSFVPNYLPVGFKLFGEQQVDDSLRWSFGLVSDRILHNLIYSEFAYSGSFYAVSVGPFLGVLNTAATPVKAGILASIRLEIQGSAFAYLRSNRSINLLGGLGATGASSLLDAVGDFQQESSDFGFGFYQPNAILTFFVSSKSYIEKKSASTEGDLVTDYGFSADIFQKNIPFRALLSFLYRNMARSFELPASLTRHSIGALVLGIRGDVSLNASFSLFAGIESSIYSFGLDKLVGQFTSSSFLFSSFIGVKAGLDPFFKSE
jgi:hypothetical protein